MSTTILVIDDSEDDQRLYLRAFKDFDGFFNLVMASSAEAGFTRIADAKPDLILLDYNLPDMDGLSFMKRLAENLAPPIPIVMLTGESSAVVAVEVMKHGADDYLVKDTDGRYLRLLPGVAGRVMTAHAQREQTEKLRKETESLLLRNQALMQNSVDGVHIMDMQGNIVEANDAFCRMLGYTPEEMSRLNVTDWDAQWSAEELRERFKWLIGKSARFETVHRCKDGALIDVEISTSGMEIEGQCFLFASSHDITNRKRAENALRESEENYRSLFENMLDGYASCRMLFEHGVPQDFIYLDVNSKFEELTGLKDVAGKKVSEVIPGIRESNPKLFETYWRVAVTGQPEKFQSYVDALGMWFSIAVYSPRKEHFIAVFENITERKQAEAALLKSEANLRAILDNSPYLTWLKDTEGRYITVNKVFADYLRLEDIKQAIGKTDLDLQPQELAEKYRADDAEVMAARQRKHVEESAFDGKTIHWVETSKTPIIDAHGNVLGTVGFARDITERKRMQLEAEALLRRNQALMKNSMDGIHVLDMQGNLVDANGAFCRMLGYSREEMAGFNVADWAAEFSGETSRVRFSDYIGKSFMIETLYRRKDGALINAEISIAREEIDGQDLLFCASRDITERKKAEKKLLLESASEHKRAEALAQQFGHLLQSSFNEIYLFDANSLRFLETSEGAEKTLGYSADELEQLTPLDLKPSYTRESFEELIAPLRRGEQQSLLFETAHRRKDGTIYPVEVRLQLMEADSPVFLAIAQDMTERSRAESQLREFSAHLQTVREEEKASVAREVHDELGGTLAALMMDAYWLTSKLAAEKGMAPLQECAKSMIGLLDTAVIATRRIITDLRPTLLDDLGLMEALKWQSAEFQKRTGIECRWVGVDDDGIEDRLDKVQLINLFRIFQEALTNVARHSDASRVEVDLYQDDEEVILSVSDNGHGLPEGHIIAPTSYGIRGMRERVVQLGGKIKFDTPSGGGFSVTVTLPLPAKNKKKA
jgi:PAS domain S-box-containing protein